MFLSGVLRQSIKIIKSLGFNSKNFLMKYPFYDHLIVQPTFYPLGDMKTYVLMSWRCEV